MTNRMGGMWNGKVLGDLHVQIFSVLFPSHLCGIFLIQGPETRGSSLQRTMAKVNSNPSPSVNCESGPIACKYTSSLLPVYK